MRTPIFLRPAWLRCTRSLKETPPAKWSRLSPYIIPIGQEVAVTPIQLAVMTAVVANGGLRLRPHVVDRLQTLEHLDIVCRIRPCSSPSMHGIVMNRSVSRHSLENAINHITMSL